LALRLAFVNITGDIGRKEQQESTMSKKLSSLLIAILIGLVVNAGYSAYAQDQQRANRASTDITEPTDENGRTPLMRAALKGDRTELLALIENGADVNGKSKSGVTALMLAAGSGRVDIVQDLLSKGADVNAKTSGNYTPLMCAALNGHTKIVKVLLDGGADVSAKDNSGQTAMKYAEAKGHADIVELLSNVKDQE
jgi:ankyrin repeat protein